MRAIVDGKRLMILINGYQVVKKIGQGGMATVYLATQISLNRPVALKVMTYGNIPGFSERFLREAKMIASLNHRHVITIYDIGVDQEHHYISMEYVTGGDLKQRISHGISPAQALDIMDKIASALQAAHDKGIIHRDVKPGNILFRKDGTPLLTDFGVAKQTDMSTRLTKTGAIVGTPAYLSPDHAHGIPLDGRADMYSLGVVFYEMLTGKRPYVGDSDINTIFKHVYEPLPVLPDEYAHLQPFLNKLLAKRREDRFEDMSAMRSALRHFTGRTIPKRQPQERAAVVKTEHGDNGQDEPSGRGVSFGSFNHTVMLATLSVVLVTVLVLFLTRTHGPLTSRGTDSRQTIVQPDDKARASRATSTHTPVKVERVLPRSRTTNQLPGDMKSKASELVDLGNARLVEHKITFPPQDNALHYFRTAQSLDPGNNDARYGLYRVASHYADLARDQLQRHRYTTARNYVDQGLSIYPGHSELRALDRRLKVETTSHRILKSIEKFTDDVVDKIKQQVHRN